MAQMKLLFPGDPVTIKYVDDDALANALRDLHDGFVRAGGQHVTNDRDADSGVLWWVPIGTPVRAEFDSAMPQHLVVDLALIHMSKGRANAALSHDAQSDGVDPHDG